MSGLRVIIIGAGLGGLCLAQGLKKHGIAVDVYEAEQSLSHRRQGYRLHINAEGQSGLRQCLPEALWRMFVETCATPNPLFTVADETLATKFSVDLAAEGGDGNLSHPSLVADRLTMRQILSAGLGGVVHLGKRLVSFEHRPGEPVTARFSDGSEASGDVLVGADGIGSVVRKHHLPGARIYDTGLRSIFGKVPLTDEATREVPDKLLHNLFTAVIGPTPALVRSAGRIAGLVYLGLAGAPRYHFAIGPFRYGRAPNEAAGQYAPELHFEDTRDYLMCTFGARQTDLPYSDEKMAAMSGAALRDLSLEMTASGGWHPGLRALLRHWDVETLNFLSIGSSIPLAPWEPSGVTFLGDAIHAMSPTGGNGANTAYRDAKGLVDAFVSIRAGKPLREAIGAYESGMRRYSAIAVRESASRGTRLVGQKPLPRH